MSSPILSCNTAKHWYENFVSRKWSGKIQTGENHVRQGLSKVFVFFIHSSWTFTTFTCMFIHPNLFTNAISITQRFILKERITNWTLLTILIANAFSCIIKRTCSCTLAFWTILISITGRAWLAFYRSKNSDCFYSKVQRADLMLHVTSIRLQLFEPWPIRDEYSSFAGA